MIQNRYRLAKIENKFRNNRTHIIVKYLLYTRHFFANNTITNKLDIIQCAPSFSPQAGIGYVLTSKLKLLQRTIRLRWINKTYCNPRYLFLRELYGLRKSPAYKKFGLKIFQNNIA